MTYTDQLKIFLENNRRKKIVFTNGCFDILHRGHVTYLNQARSLGEVLVIGLNSDMSVKKLKGPTRPINNQEDRKFLLTQLRCVDFVEIFEEETPLKLIEFIRPDVLVKGGDWDVKKIVGYDFVIKNGGSVHSLNFVNGYSTSSTIEKIQKN